MLFGGKEGEQVFFLENEGKMVLFLGCGPFARRMHFPPPGRACSELVVGSAALSAVEGGCCAEWLLDPAARRCTIAATHSPLPFGASLLQVGEEEDGEGEGSPAAGESHGLLGGQASSRHSPCRLLGVSGRTLFGSTSGSGGSGPPSGWWGRLRGLGQLWRSSMQVASSSGGSRGGADWSGGGSGGV